MQGQTSDALFDALVMAQVQPAVALLLSPPRLLPTASQAAGGTEVRWPDFRALFAQLELGPLTRGAM